MADDETAPANGPTSDEIALQLQEANRHATEASASAEAAMASVNSCLGIMHDVMRQMAVPPADDELSTITITAQAAGAEETGTLAFVIERTGPAVHPCSVQWTRSGTAADSDFVEGTEKSGTLAWGEGDTTERRIELALKPDATPEPDETVVITLSEPTNAKLGDAATASTTVRNDDAPTSGQVCDNPRMGPVRRLPTNKRLLMWHVTRATGSYAGLAPILPQMTNVVFIPGGQWPIPGGVYDHSDAGIRAHGDAVWASFVKGRGGDSQKRILWWDWEEMNRSKRSSKNVPAEVGYDAARDKFHAAFYELTIFPGYTTFQVTQEHAEKLRKEAVRYGAALAKRIIERADAAGVTGFEQFSYTHPDLPGKGSSWASQARDLQKDWFCPYMLGGGLPCYFSGSIEEMNANVKNPGHWTANFATRVAEQRKAFGPSFKIIPTIWCKWYRSDGGSNSVNSSFPNSDPCVPAGFMTKAFNTILDAGADGACFFQNADMNNASGALAARYSDRHGEVAKIVKDRGDFVGIRY